MMTVRYRHEVLDPTVKRYESVVGPMFDLMDGNAHSLYQLSLTHLLIRS